MDVDFETSPFTGTIFFNNEEIQQVKRKLFEKKIIIIKYSNIKF